MVESAPMRDDHPPVPSATSAQSTGARSLSPAAARALKEAAARRAEIDARAALPPEKGARREREPVRYGDWEKKGLASDF